MSNVDFPRNIVSDSTNGIVITINISTGTYYSLTEEASALWGKIQGGSTDFGKRELSILKALASESMLETNLDLSEIEALAGELCFQKFSDMEELLLGDPIHDVDDDGWPTLK